MSSLWRQFFDAEFQLRLSLSVGMMAIQCLLAIWAAMSRRHWFWRAAAVTSSVMLMVPIRAWEPAWLFGFSSPLIVVTLILSQRVFGQRKYAGAPAGSTVDHGPDDANLPWPAAQPTATHIPQSAGRRLPKLRFTLRDLFLLPLAVALALPGLIEVLRNYRPTNWLGWLVASTTVALLAVLSYGCTRPPRRWLDVALLGFAIVETAIAVWLD